VWKSPTCIGIKSHWHQAENTATEIRHGERNAPPGHVPRSEADPELEDLRRRVDEAIDAGLPPAAVADLVVRGMAERRTHLFPHPEWLDRWDERVAKVREQLRPVETVEVSS